MVSQTNEQALEACIERAMTGISREELKEQAGTGDMVAFKASAHYSTNTGHGYQLGWSSDYNREFAVDTAKLWSFLEATQADELAKLKDQPNWQRLVLEMLNKRVKKRGILKVLKNVCRLTTLTLPCFTVPPTMTLTPRFRPTLSATCSR